MDYKCELTRRAQHSRAFNMGHSHLKQSGQGAWGFVPTMKYLWCVYYDEFMPVTQHSLCMYSRKCRPIAQHSVHMYYGRLML